MGEARAQTGGTGRRPKLKTRRAVGVRVAVYTVSAVLSVWLVVSVVVALARGLANNSAVDPFTQAPVQSNQAAP